MAGYDAIVVGGGLVGASIAYGLVRRGLAVAMVDESDVAFRASRGNFGLIWVQGKGRGMPAYAGWTLRSSRLWPTFAAELEDRTGIGIHYSRQGGVHVCLDEIEMAGRATALADIKTAGGEESFEYAMMDAKDLRTLLPGLGPEVAGGSFSPDDGTCSPLYLLRALHAAFRSLGGTYMPAAPACRLRPEGNGFALDAGSQVVRADRVVLAAGLGTPPIATQVGLDVPVRPERGQILVSHRLRPLFSVPTAYVRQTAEGSLLCGDSHEDVGFDVGTRVEIMAAIARRTVRTFPFLAQVPVARAWGALRVMTPDGFPIYDRSEAHGGAFAVTCHSGVTLAAVHADVLSGWIAGEEQSPAAMAFSARRFHVQTAA